MGPMNNFFYVLVLVHSDVFLVSEALPFGMFGNHLLLEKHPGAANSVGSARLWLVVIKRTSIRPIIRLNHSGWFGKDHQKQTSFHLDFRLIFFSKFELYFFLKKHTRNVLQNLIT